MNCAPGKVLLLCMAALAVNAAAFELNIFPDEGIANAFSGNSALLSEFVDFHISAGDTDAAERKLENFSKNFPEVNVDFENAKIKLAQGKRGEAMAILRKIAADEKHNMHLEVCLYLADFWFFKGKFISAFPFFKSLDKKNAPDDLRFRGRSGTILCLLQSGLYEQSGILLDRAIADFPQHLNYWEQVKVALLGKSGKYADLEKFWRSVRHKHDPEASALLFDGLRAGAEAAEKNRALGTAEYLEAESFAFAADNIARRNVLKDLISLQSRHFPERALKSIERYFLYFPEDPALPELKLIKGEICNKLARYDEARALLMLLLNDGSADDVIKAKAAVMAAFSAEKLSDIASARELYNSAIRRLTPGSSESNQIKMQLLEFLLRRKEYSPAAILGEELAGIGNIDQEKLNLYRLEALMALKRYKDAESIAVGLSGSGNPELAAEGVWQLAKLHELQKHLAEARKIYQEFIRRFPGEGRLPGAMLAAADAAMRLGRFREAAAEFGEFIKRYPDHRGVRGAVLAALYSSLRLEQGQGLENSEQLLGKLEKEFSGSNEFEEGVMEVAMFYFKKGRYDEALELLEKFLRMRPDSSKSPEALILAVKLFEKIGNYTTAVEYADRILDKYPNTTFAVEAAMRGGSSCFQSGKYQQALKYYERAGELGGHGVMAQIAAGEAADCHLLLRKPENLAAARRIYARLASETEFPALRVQALYKLGLAFEYSSMNMKALEVYEKLLSLAVSSAKIRNSSGVGSWCARAAHSALRIILSAVDMPDGSQRAQRVYQMYSYLALPGSSDELRNYLKEIQKHYNLLD